MTHTELSEVELQNLLDDITESVVVDRYDVKTILRRYGLGAENSEIQEFATLIRLINQVMPSQTPSDRFLQNLKAELVGEETRLFAALRRFPIRAQIAAGVAAVAAGVLFISRRRDDKEMDNLAEQMEATALH